MPTALVVDDEPAIRELFHAFLSLQGYTVHTAADGVEGLAQAHRLRPQLMFLDNHMPRLTGLQVLERLQAAARETAVIFMSGLLDEQTCQTAQAFGARACLQKPIGLPDLARCLADLRARPRIRVLLADDHALVRRTLAGLLHAEPDLEVVGEVGDGQQAVAMARRLLPDVVLMDISMPGMDGLHATRAIKAACPTIQVIGLSAYDHTEQAQPMLDAGAVGYVSKTETAEALLAVIRTCRTWTAGTARRA